MIKKVLLYSILLSFVISALGQTYTVKNYRGELNIKLAPKYEKKMENMVEKLNEADQLEKSAVEVIAEIENEKSQNERENEYKKAINTLHDVSKLYQEAHQGIYEIYFENCDLARARMKTMHHYSSGLLKAKFYEIRSEKGMSRAASIREIVDLADKPGWLQYKMSEAIELEKLAIRDKGRALNIMQDFPVEYDYGWENDVTLDEVEAALGDPAINRPPDDLFVQKPAPKKDTVTVDTADYNVLFSVQIAAHTSPLPKEYLEKIYHGNMEVHEKTEGGWFKYTIGNYDNFTDANALLQRCKVERAFIVAYHNGEKLTIKEALERIRQDQ